MEITLNEVPYVSTFSFVGSDGCSYKLVCGKKIKGFESQIWKDNQVVSSENINWNIPPDYEAARELIEIFIRQQ